MQAQQKFQVIEFYDGKRTVLYETDDLQDAKQHRAWEIEQWSDQAAARLSVRIVTA